MADVLPDPQAAVPVWRFPKTEQVVYPLLVIFAISYLVALALVFYDYPYYADKLKDTTSTRVELAFVISGRFHSNWILGVIYGPWHFLCYCWWGIGKGATIIGIEASHIPEIFQWIFDNWIIQWIKTWFAALFGWMGGWLTPLWTYFVRFVIYLLVGTSPGWVPFVVYRAIVYIVQHWHEIPIDIRPH